MTTEEKKDLVIKQAYNIINKKGYAVLSIYAKKDPSYIVKEKVDYYKLDSFLILLDYPEIVLEISEN